MKVCVIGAGASGLFCAGFIKNYGHDVIIFDGNEKAGKKIYITGNISLIFYLLIVRAQ